MKNKSWLLIVVAVIAILLYSAAYMVDETQQVVITQFGRIVGEPVTTPGLHFKIPFIQRANVFNKNLLDWDFELSNIKADMVRYELLIVPRDEDEHDEVAMAKAWKAVERDGFDLNRIVVGGDPFSEG